MEKIDKDSYGFPDFDDFEQDPVDMETFVNLFTAQMVIPDAIPSKDLPSIVSTTKMMFRTLAKDLGTPVPDEDGEEDEEIIPEKKKNAGDRRLDVQCHC